MSKRIILNGNIITEKSIEPVKINSSIKINYLNAIWATIFKRVLSILPYILISKNIDGLNGILLGGSLFFIIEVVRKLIEIKYFGRQK